MVFLQTFIKTAAISGIAFFWLNPIQTGGGGGVSNPPSGKIVITFTPKKL